MKKIILKSLLILGCFFSVAFASDTYTYTHHNWTCVQKDETNVASSDTIVSGKTYTTYTYNWNGENYWLSSKGCVGKGTNTDYSISYNLNGGSLSGSVTYNSNGTFTLPTATKSNNDFLGWTGSNGSTAQTSVTVSDSQTGNLSYTANWAYRPNVDVNIVIDGTTYYSGNGSSFLFDVYLNGNLYKSGLTDFNERVANGTKVKVVPTTNGTNYTLTTWEFTASGNQDYSGGPSWNIKIVTGTQYKVSYSKTTYVSKTCYTTKSECTNWNNHVSISCPTNNNWASTPCTQRGYSGLAHDYGNGTCVCHNNCYTSTTTSYECGSNTTSYGTTGWQWNTDAPSGTTRTGYTSKKVCRRADSSSWYDC